MSGTVITRWPAWKERPSAKKGCNFQPAHSRGESAATHQPSSSCLGALVDAERGFYGEASQMWCCEREQRCLLSQPGAPEGIRQVILHSSLNFQNEQLVTYGSLAENKEAPSEKDTKGSGKRMVAGKGEGTPGSPGPTADGGQGSGQPKMPAVLSHTGCRVGSCARWRTPS